jgi:hypothetical protein
MGLRIADGIEDMRVLASEALVGSGSGESRSAPTQAIPSPSARRARYRRSIVLAGSREPPPSLERPHRPQVARTVV